MRKLKVGIDLGTTTTLVAVTELDAESLVPFGKTLKLEIDGSVNLPYLNSISWFSRARRDNPVVGYEAKVGGPLDPDGRVVRDIKREMGKQAPPIVWDGNEYTPPLISSYYIEKVLSGAGIAPGDIEYLTVTVPASFTSTQRKDTKEAVNSALDRIGLSTSSSKANQFNDLISEPLAALISFVSEDLRNGTRDGGKCQIDYTKDKGNRVLVYDLGGGTLDLTVVNLTLSDNQSSVDLNSIDWNIEKIGRYNEIGGTDCDQIFASVILEHLLKQHSDVAQHNLSENEANSLQAILLSAGEEMKIEFNDAYDEVDDDFTFSCSFEIQSKPYEVELSMSVEETKARLSDLLGNSSSEYFKPVFDLFSSEYLMEDVGLVLCVGGMTRLGYLQDQISEILDTKVVPVPHPQEAVVKGAAIYSELRSQGEVIKEPASDDYYIRKKSGFYKVLHRNDFDNYTETKHQLADRSEHLKLRIFAGEESDTDPLLSDSLSSLVYQGGENLSLGSFYDKGTEVIVRMRFSGLDKIPEVQVEIDNEFKSDWAHLDNRE
jgi:molecular chaperone DnaK (HSP70)